MPLTLNQFLFLVLTMAAVVAVTFLALFLNQLRKTARQGEKTLAEVRELAQELRVLEQKVNARVDDVGEIMESSKKVVAGVSEVLLFATTRIIRPASRYWPVLYPLLQLGWRHYKKRKERKDVG